MFSPNDLIITMKLIKKTNKRMNDYLIFAGVGSLFAIHNECDVISKNLTFSLQKTKERKKERNNQASKQTTKETNKQASKQTSKQTNKQIKNE
jgi:hypothetical protein